MPDQTDVRQSGIIPACAGSTTAPSEPKPAPRDHPRMCGEHCVVLFHIWTLAGSSPHVRGAPSVLMPDGPATGIIPACAGSTLRILTRPPPIRDHPRMCGEHAVFIKLSTTTPGSSPHVRGALGQNRRHSDTGEIIPACAGSTRLACPTRHGIWDHPRMCGEHTIESANKATATGSSPHVRGARVLSASGGGRAGIIPACAGSTAMV